MTKEMRPCLIYPNREILDPGGIRAFAQVADELGYEAVLAYDHVILSQIPAGNRQYDISIPFQEPFVLFGYLSGITKQIKFVTAVLVTPQRPTALIAKQAADIQRLSAGRLILGVGIGNNPIEFAAMGKPFAGRHQLYEKQIEFLRRLWTGEAVSGAIGEEKFNQVGINPSAGIFIPIWMGGFADPAIDRTARLADGYIPMGGPKTMAPRIAKLRELLDEYQRDQENFPILGAFPTTETYMDLGWTGIGQVIKAWKQLGISHLAFGTQGNGFGVDISSHLKLMKDFKKVFEDNV